VVAEPPVEEPPVEEPVVETPVEEAVVEETVAEPVVDEPVAEPVVEETVAEPVAEQPIEETVEPTVEKVIEVPVVETKTRKPKSVIGTIFAGLFAAILGVLCFAVLCVAGVSYITRYLTYSETIETIAASIDVLNLPVEGTLMAEAGGTVLEAVHVMSGGLGLSEADIQTIYEDTTFRNELIRIVSDYAEYIRTGNPPEKLTTDDVKAIFEENLTVINRVLERAGEPPLNPHDKALALANIDAAQGFLDLLAVDSLENYTGGFDVVGVVRMAISFPVIIGEIVFALIIMLIIGGFCKNVRTPLLTGGLAALFAGGVLAGGLYTLENSAIVLINNLAIRTVLTDTVGAFSEHIYIVCGITAAVGLVMIIISRIRIRKTAIA
jgi:hypothetical protein